MRKGAVWPARLRTSRAASHCRDTSRPRVRPIFDTEVDLRKLPWRLNTKFGGMSAVTFAGRWRRSVDALWQSQLIPAKPCREHGKTGSLTHSAF